MRVVVSGASGLIGSALSRSLAAGGHQVVRLVRLGAGSVPSPPDVFSWDPAAGRIDPAALVGADAAVVLSGAGIGDRRWSRARRAELISSRLSAVELVAKTVASLSSPPGVVVQASAIGIYGDRGDEELTERSDLGHGFLAELCRAWEQAASALDGTGVRHVALRSGIVLTPDGGALARQLPLFRHRLGGRLGAGSQWTSWISLEDEVRAIEHAVAEPSVTGPVNLVSPQPVTNREFTAALARAVHRSARLAVPATALRLALGRDMTDEMVLASQRVTPAVLADSGFSFVHDNIDDALAALLPLG